MWSTGIRSSNIYIFYKKGFLEILVYDGLYSDVGEFVSVAAFSTLQSK